MAWRAFHDKRISALCLEPPDSAVLETTYQVIGAFNKEYVKTGVFPSSFTKMIQHIYDLR